MLERSRTQHQGACALFTQTDIAQLDIACGTSNALLSIVEPCVRCAPAIRADVRSEKCEYLFKMTSPAACRPADQASTGKTEL